MMQLRQKCCDGTTDQMSLSRCHQFNSRPIGQLDEATLIDRDDGRGAGLDQRLQSLLRLQTQASIANQLSNEQSTAGERQGLEAQTNEGLLKGAEDFGKHRAGSTQQSHEPPRQ